MYYTQLKTYIENYKKGEEESLIQIIEVLMPVIKKYTKYLYKDDSEDVREELILAIIIALKKMSYIGSEGECVNYLVNSIKMKFYELYRKSVLVNEMEEIKEENTFEIIFMDAAYENISFFNDMRQFSLNYKGKTQEIFLDFILNDYTETQLSKKYHTSRQYMNKLRKNFYKNLEDNYFRKT